MLDNEIDDNQNASHESVSAERDDLPAPPRPRRAASRPAGPPDPIKAEAARAAASESDAATKPAMTSESAPEAAAGAEASEAAPAKAPRKRATRKKSAAKAAEPETGAEATAAPRKRAPRKKAAAKKTSPQVEQPVTAEEAATPVVDAPAEEIAAEPVAAEPVAEDGPAVATKPSQQPVEEEQLGSEPETSARPEVEQKPEPSHQPEEAAAPEADRRASVLTDPFQPPLEAAAEDADESDEAEAAAEDDTADQPETTPEAGGGEASSEQDPGDDNAEGSESGTRRRRRRRGGRRRRRGGDQNDNDESGGEGADTNEETGSDKEQSDDSESGQNGDDADDSADAGDSGGGDGRRRRRRRRRRGGEDSGDDDGSENRNRDRRGRTDEEVTGIDGSTRMEAKRQRRREGRAAGRRRAPILSEAEFLARRELVERTMVIRQNEELSQLAVLEDGVLVEHYVDRASALSQIGNVYLGRVQNVLPSMEAAFIDIGRGRNAVLYAGEVDWNSFGAEGQNRKVEKALKSGQPILVQVTKDPVGSKGARLTNHISLPGRYIVYSPGGHLSGISRKLPDTERRRLKDILADLVPEDASVIVRTAAEGASEDELVRDVNRLKAQWEVIEKKVKGGQAPQQLYAEPDPTVRIVRDLFTEDFAKLVIEGNGSMNDAYDTVTAYVGHVAPHLAERIERWNGDSGRDLFAAYRIDEQIAKALERKVYLPSGGSLIIDRTEAMTVIDVNTGKFTGSGGNLEATVTSNNLEAAEEMVRQLRLRDIGGIIVIDFIDMVLPSNRELLLRRMVECLGRDRTRHQVSEVTSLGLVQLTRKRIGTGLAEAFTEECEHCKGRGYEIHDMPVDSQAQADGGDRGARRNRGGRNRDNNNNRNRKGADTKNDEKKDRQSRSHETGRSDDSGTDAETNDNSDAETTVSKVEEAEVAEAATQITDDEVDGSAVTEPAAEPTQEEPASV